jgi:hypothetical protein
MHIITLPLSILCNQYLWLHSVDIELSLQITYKAYQSKDLLMCQFLMNVLTHVHLINCTVSSDILLFGCSEW